MQRKYQILRRVIEEFIKSAHPVSSGQFAKNSEFDVSSATIRNEMADLEKEGLVIQPHTSAGRVPTTKGYQFFVEKLMDISEEEQKDLYNEFLNAQKKHFLHKVREKVYDGVAILSQLTENVAFATIPENHQTIFLGLANFLKQPEFSHDAAGVSGVVEVLESGFFDSIKQLEIGKNIDIHIGENNIFPQFESCSLLCTSYQSSGFSGVLGILGPVRMNYARNKALIEYTKLFIEGQKLLGVSS